MNFNKVRKIVGGAILTFAILLAIPPVVPTFFDDLINIFLAVWFVSLGMDKLNALLATYTIVPFSLFCVGVFIYPAKNGKVVNIYVKKLRGIFKWFLKSLKSPKFLIVMLITMAVIYYLYTKILSSMIGLL